MGKQASGAVCNGLPFCYLYTKLKCTLELFIFSFLVASSMNDIYSLSECSELTIEENRSKGGEEGQSTRLAWSREEVLGKKVPFREDGKAKQNLSPLQKFSRQNPLFNKFLAGLFQSGYCLF